MLHSLFLFQQVHQFRFAEKRRFAWVRNPCLKLREAHLSVLVSLLLFEALKKEGDTHFNITDGSKDNILRI